MKRWLAIIALALAGCAGPLSMHARGGAMSASRAGAAAAFDEGVAAYQHGEYVRAERAFTEAFALEPSPVVRFNLARVHDTLGHPAIAARYYLGYARMVPSLTPDEQREIAAALARIGPRVGWLVVRASRPVRIDGEPVSDGVREVGLAVPVPLEPGVRSVRVEGREPMAVRVRAGDVLSLDFVAEDHGTPTVLIAPGSLATLHLGDWLRAATTGVATR